MAWTTIQFTITQEEGGLWARVVPALGDFDDAHINEILRWVLEQLNFGQWMHTTDEGGRLTSITVGLPAAADAAQFTVDDYAEELRGRLRAVDLSGVFARGREEGVAPENQELAEKVRLSATEEGGHRNTEIHYAFELLDILADIRKNTFVFATPPIVGVAKPEVRAILREATRAYLFRQMRSCASLCRALVEATLKSCISKEDLITENRRTGVYKGDLECLIDVAMAREILSAPMGEQAHEIRRFGNSVLHQRADPDPQRVWGTLLDTRAIVEAVYSAPGRNQ